MVLKQLGKASVSIQAGLDEFLELKPNSNTGCRSGRMPCLSTSFNLFLCVHFSMHQNGIRYTSEEHQIPSDHYMSEM